MNTGHKTIQGMTIHPVSFCSKSLLMNGIITHGRVLRVCSALYSVVWPKFHPAGENSPSPKLKRMVISTGNNSGAEEMCISMW